MIKNDFLVSIIIPVYNIEKELLKRCIDSVLAQTHARLQVIIVDDGSTDGSGEYADELAKQYLESERRDDRRSITVIHKPNGGSSDARNVGIDAAIGDYLSFIDCDDYVDDDFIELMADAMVRYNVRMVQISRDEIAEDGTRLADVCIPPAEEKLITAREQTRELLMHRGDCSFCTRLTHKALFEGRRFPKGKLNEDFRLLMDMLGDAGDFVILPRQAYHVYYRTGSNSRSGDKEVFRTVYEDIVDNADYATELVRERYPELTEEAKRFALFQRLDYMLHIPVSMMNGDNAFYAAVVRYLRYSIIDTVFNRYLTVRNKVYLLLLTIAPRHVRKIHKKLRSI